MDKRWIFYLALFMVAAFVVIILEADIFSSCCPHRKEISKNVHDQFDDTQRQIIRINTEFLDAELAKGRLSTIELHENNYDVQSSENESKDDMLPAITNDPAFNDHLSKKKNTDHLTPLKELLSSPKSRNDDPKTSINTSETSKGETEVQPDSQEDRQTRLRDFCARRYPKNNEPSISSKVLLEHLMFSDKRRVLYCYVPKVACTNWKRMFLFFENRTQHPMEIADKQQVHKLKYDIMVTLSEKRRQKRTDYYAFAFVRHPFARVASAYRNKLLSPYNEIFRTRFGSRILRAYRAGLTEREYASGRNVTFAEFVRFLIDEHAQSGTQNYNDHWQVTNELCGPCNRSYNFIGKFETLVTDANQVLDELGLADVRFPANATDKYKGSINEFMLKCFKTLSVEQIMKLHEIYRDDFEAFGYTIPKVLLT